MIWILLLTAASLATEPQFDLAASRFKAACIDGTANRSSGIREVAAEELPGIVRDRRGRSRNAHHFGFRDNSEAVISVYRWSDPKLAYHTVCVLTVPGSDFGTLFSRIAERPKLGPAPTGHSWMIADYLSGDAPYRLRANTLGSKHIFIEAALFTEAGRKAAEAGTFSSEVYADSLMNFRPKRQSSR